MKLPSIERFKILNKVPPSEDIDSPIHQSETRFEVPKMNEVIVEDEDLSEFEYSSVELADLKVLMNSLESLFRPKRHNNEIVTKMSTI